MDLRFTKWVGKIRYHFEEIDSTNKKAKELAAQGCPHGTLITADNQLAGVGRRGRSWNSQAGAGIYMSVVLRPQVTTTQAPMLTLVAAMAVANAIKQLLADKHVPEAMIQKLQIKWPNDIVCNGKKLCGILTEMILEQNQIGSVVVGIGINVTNTNFPEELCATASSIYKETGVCLEKDVLIETIGQFFEAYYERFEQAGDLTTLKQEYEELLVNKDTVVCVLEPQGNYTGIARGITNTGELFVETDDGITTVASGEVSVRGIYGYV